MVAQELKIKKNGNTFYNLSFDQQKSEDYALANYGSVTENINEVIENKYFTLTSKAKKQKTNMLSWDVIGGYLYTISTIDALPEGVVFRLQRYLLDELEEFRPSAQVEQVKKYFMERKFQEISGLEPLSDLYNNAIYGLDGVAGPIYYDFVVSESKGNSIFLFIYLEGNEEIRLYEYSGEHANILSLGEGYRELILDWSEVAKYPAVLKGPFNVFERKGKFFIFSQDGIIYSYEKGINEVGKWSSNPGNYVIVFDKVAQEVFVFEKQFLELNIPFEYMPMEKWLIFSQTTSESV